MEMFSLSFMVNAFIACLIFGLMLSYLGIHVVGRGIVFVDLALGQISSLGVALSEFTHFGDDWLPLAFTVLGAILLSQIHVRDRRLRLEAIIGIIYVVASAVTVLIISKTPHGDSHIQEVLFGALLAVSDAEIVKLLIVFSVLAILHALFQRHIFRLTAEMQAGHIEGFELKDRLWNFFFYISIGIAIVFAVQVGGVLPVFAYLVVPAVSALLLGRSTRWTVVLAALAAVITSYLGLWFSYTYDFPAGPSVVAFFGVIFLLASLYRFITLRLKTT